MPEEHSSNRLSIDEQRLKRLTAIRQRQSHSSVEHLSVNNVNQENLETIFKKVYDKETHHQDERDINLQPSYTKFQVPYYIKCRNRLNASKQLYEQRFQYEIEQLIGQQTTGYEAARLNRHLCITTIWPPLHNRNEIDHTQRYFFSSTRKERQRLNWIMNTNII